MRRNALPAAATSTMRFQNTVVCAKHWCFRYVLGMGTSGFILLGQALTDSSIQPTVSLITLSETLSLATGTIYVETSNKKQVPTYICTIDWLYTHYCGTEKPKASGIRYNYLKEVREETWSDGARYDGRRTLPRAMRTMLRHLVTRTENGHKRLC